jgi:hypothetical protein
MHHRRVFIVKSWYCVALGGADRGGDGAVMLVLGVVVGIVAVAVASFLAVGVLLSLLLGVLAWGLGKVLCGG